MCPQRSDVSYAVDGGRHHVRAQVSLTTYMGPASGRPMVLEWPTSRLQIWRLRWPVLPSEDKPRGFLELSNQFPRWWLLAPQFFAPASSHRASWLCEPITLEIGQVN
jgi:hypothetical protein